MDTTVNTYIEGLNVLSSSGVGVVLTRTREPYRAEEALMAFAMMRDKPFYDWKVTRGWLEGRADCTPDKACDPYIALKKILDVDGGGKTPMPEGVYAMHYPHWFLSKHVGLVQLLKEYSREFMSDFRRLVLLVPEGFILPPELQNDIVVHDLELPNRVDLKSVYDMVAHNMEGAGNTLDFDDCEKELLLSSGAGMTEVEFDNALNRAIMENRDSWGELTIEQVNDSVLRTKTEVVKRSEVLELMPCVSMEEVGGLDLAKAWIAKRRYCFSEEAKAFGVDAPKGIACIGQPGTGKSLLAKAIAGSLSLPLVKFDIGKVFGSLVGQSEERVRSALKQIDALAPVVVLVDEVDKSGLDPRSGGGDSGTSKRVMGNILTHMQETKAPVFWVLTANRVDGLPPELLRKGRLDEVFAVLPPNQQEREAIIRIHLKKRNQGDIEGLDDAVKKSKGFVGAEIESAIKEAVIEAYTSDCDVTGELIAKQLSDIKPISEAFKEDFDRMGQWAQKNARLASSVLEDDDSVVRVRKRSRKVGDGQ